MRDRTLGRIWCGHTVCRPICFAFPWQCVYTVVISDVANLRGTWHVFSENRDLPNHDEFSSMCFPLFDLKEARPQGLRVWLWLSIHLCSELTWNKDRLSWADRCGHARDTHKRSAGTPLPLLQESGLVVFRRGVSETRASRVTLEWEATRINDQASEASRNEWNCPSWWRNGVSKVDG